MVPALLFPLEFLKNSIGHMNQAGQKSDLMLNKTAGKFVVAKNYAPRDLRRMPPQRVLFSQRKHVQLAL